MEEEPNFIEAFNKGYKLARYRPDLVEGLKDSINPHDSLYNIGMEQGILAGEEEREQSRLNELNEAREDRDSERELER